uniref:GRIP domain-containing protein n=1 Tax=Strongyloides papillosus TaxID=174720 RepID=A0A0N5B1S7_STREA
MNGNINYKTIGVTLDRNGKVQVSEENIKKLCNELEYFSRKINLKTQTVLKISQDLSLTHTKLEESEKNCQKLEIDIRRGNEIIEGLKKEFEKDYSKLRDKCNQLVKEKETLKKENEYLLKENDQLKDEVRNLRKDCLGYRQKIAKLEVKEIKSVIHKEQSFENEELKKRSEELKKDVSILLCDKEELIKERDCIKEKMERLSQEIIYLLNGDPKAIDEDIDRIISDNRIMKAQLENMKQERGLTKAALKKYKSLLGKHTYNNNNDDNEPFDCQMEDFFSNRNSKVITFKQIKELLGSTCEGVTEEDYKTLTLLLVDYCNDKKLALTHQRNANKILGKKVSDMELKIKNLEKNKERICKSPNKDFLNELLTKKDVCCKNIQVDIQ